MVRVHQDPPNAVHETRGGIAQLGEHLLCKQGVNGSIPLVSTKHLRVYKKSFKIKIFCERAAIYAVCFVL